MKMENDIKQLWKTFLMQSMEQMKEIAERALLPGLASRMLYAAWHQESWEYVCFKEAEHDLCQIPSWCNGKAQINGASYRHVYNRRYDDEFYLRRVAITEDLPVSEFLELHQFVHQNVHGDWNLPGTWEDHFSDEFLTTWIVLETWETFFNDNVPDEMLEYLRYEQENQPFEDNTLWHYVYVEEVDGGMLSKTAFSMGFELLEILKLHTLGQLRKEFEFAYRRHLIEVAKKEHAEKERQQILKDRALELEELGKSRLVEFHKRLGKKHALTIPGRIEFRKDLPHWPLLKDTLETFSSEDRAAIVSVSGCSNSVRENYIDKFRT